jgi:hypothetical protein
LQCALGNVAVVVNGILIWYQAAIVASICTLQPLQAVEANRTAHNNCRAKFAFAYHALGYYQMVVRVNQIQIVT